MPNDLTQNSLREVFNDTRLGLSADTADDTPQVFLQRYFGPNVSVKPIIYVEGLGSWVNGWSVVVEHADTGVHAFLLRGRNEFETVWDGTSRWQRLELLDRSLATVRSGRDRVALSEALLREVADDGIDPRDFDNAGVLNDAYPTWGLHHLLATLSTHERETFDFLVGLAHGAAVLDHVQRMVGAAHHARMNYLYDDEAEASTRAAGLRHNGVSLSGAQIESLRVPGALLVFARQDWDTEALRLVESAYARKDLPADYYPPPDPPPTKPTARTGKAPGGKFVIAA